MKRHVLQTFYAPEAPPAGGGTTTTTTTTTDDAAAAAAAAAAGGAQTPEQKAAADKVVSDKAAADAAAAAAAATEAAKAGNKDGAPLEQPKAPEKYALTLSDDAKALLDEKDVQGLEAFAKGMNLTNEQAQAYLEQHVVGVKALSDSFLTETKADATFGGDSLEATQRYATSALDAFAPKGDKYGDMVRTILTKNGYGNNLGILAMLARAGKAIAEDKPGAQRGGATTQNKADAAAKLYDHPTSVQK